MKRFALIGMAVGATGLGVLAGCGQKWNNPLATKSQLTPSATKTPDQADYFELKQDGKTYVLGSSASRTAFASGQMPALKETPLDNGKMIYVENANFTDYNRLVAEYKKSKGM